MFDVCVRQSSRSPLPDRPDGQSLLAIRFLTGLARRRCLKPPLRIPPSPRIAARPMVMIMVLRFLGGCCALAGLLAAAFDSAFRLALRVRRRCRGAAVYWCRCVPLRLPDRCAFLALTVRANARWPSCWP